MSSKLKDQIAKAIGDAYDGYADPVATPNNWARAFFGAQAALSAIEEAGYILVPKPAKPAGCEPCSWPECGCQYSPKPMTSAKPSPSYATRADSATTFDPERKFDQDRAAEERMSKGLDQAITDELANGPKSIMEGK